MVGMSAANAKAQEPSMEEILASIRRIIADDPAPAAMSAKDQAAEPPVAHNDHDTPRLADPAEAPAGAASDAQPEEHAFGPVEDDILDLDEDVAVTETAAEQAPVREAPAQAEARAAFQGHQDLEFVDSAPARPGPAAAAPYEASDRLVSPQTDTVVNQAFSSLANAMFTQNARSIEDLVRDMLRPMLKVWLDDNLPTIVERLVRAEIERVARGGR